MKKTAWFQKSALWISFQLVFIASTHAAVPGLIPLDEARLPATDLTLRGKTLTLDEASRMRASGTDLSTLDPAESDLWKGEAPVSIDLPSVEIQNGDTVSFDSFVASRSGNLRFSAYARGKSGLKPYTFLFSKKAHNVLLRAALLRKLGYQVAPIRHLSKVHLRFASRFEKENFVKEMWNKTFGSPEERWIVSEAEDGKLLILQDMIVTDNDVHFYNLALGSVPAPIIQGRRVLNSLLVPFSLVDVPESVNLYGWYAGLVTNRQIRLDYDAAEGFTTSLEDARWIARRMARLDRQDFEEIAAAGRYPIAVQKLLVEKLISRRNSLLKLLELGGDEIPVETGVTLQPDLIDGKLSRERWEGFGSRFSYGDPESPLSSSEIPALFQSELISQLISVAVNQFNTRFTNTDLAEKIYQAQISRFNQELEKMMTTGEIKPTPFAVDAVPFANFNLIISRDVVAGSYMGADNRVQLADSLGFSVDAGVYLGTSGLPTTLPITVDGSVRAHFNRVYSHLKPIKSIRAALKTPFKNLLVPLLKKEYGHLLDDVVSKEAAWFETEDGQKRLTQIVEVFKKDLEIGDSILVSDSIGAGIQAGAGYGFSKIVNARARFMGDQIVIQRMHIHRANEDTIQIYKDNGNLGSLTLHMGFNAAVPVVSLSLKGSAGQARIQFHQLDIHDKAARNKDIVRNLVALRSLLLTQSLELVQEINKPYIVTHQIKDKTGDVSLFHWRWRRQDTRDWLSVSHPDGGDKRFLKLLSGKRSGSNYEDFVIDSLNELIRAYTDKDIDFKRVGNTDPGNTIKGSSHARVAEYEAEVREKNGKQESADDHIKIFYRWKGWDISRKGAQRILDEVNTRYGRDFFPELTLKDTRKLQLYNITVSMFFYQGALKALLEQDAATLKRVFDEEGNFSVAFVGNKTEYELRRDRIELLVEEVQLRKRRYLNARASGDVNAAAKESVNLIGTLEANLSLKGLLQLIGGEENIFVFGGITGFREGDESGDTAFQTGTIGKIGSRYYAGPVSAMKSRLGMNESSFYAYWLLERL